MRGALTGNPKTSGSARIIPADAGSTSRPAAQCPHEGDHPRGCGEHSLTEDGPSRLDGSSPRMRGALVGP